MFDKNTAGYRQSNADTELSPVRTIKPLIKCLIKIQPGTGRLTFTFLLAFMLLNVHGGEMAY